MADEFRPIVRIEIGDINGGEKTIKVPFNNLKAYSAIEFRKWADIRVYGDYRVVWYREETHYHLVRYVADNGFLTLENVEHHEEPTQQTRHAVFRAEIGWFNPAGLRRHFNDDGQWSDMIDEATRITIRPGAEHQELLVQLPIPQAGPIVGPHAVPQLGQQSDSQSGPKSVTGPGTGPLVDPHFDPNHGPLSLQTYDPLQDPQSGPQSDPQSGQQSLTGREPGPLADPQADQIGRQYGPQPGPQSDTQADPHSLTGPETGPLIGSHDDPQVVPQYGPLSVQQYDPLFDPQFGLQSDPQSGPQSPTDSLSSILLGLLSDPQYSPESGP